MPNKITTLLFDKIRHYNNYTAKPAKINVLYVVKYTYYDIMYSVCYTLLSIAL